METLAHLMTECISLNDKSSNMRYIGLPNSVCGEELIWKVLINNYSLFAFGGKASLGYGDNFSILGLCKHICLKPRIKYPIFLGKKNILKISETIKLFLKANTSLLAIFFFGRLNLAMRDGKLIALVNTQSKFCWNLMEHMTEFFGYGKDYWPTTINAIKLAKECYANIAFG